MLAVEQGSKYASEWSGWTFSFDKIHWKQGCYVDCVGVDLGTNILGIVSKCRF